MCSVDYSIFIMFLPFTLQVPDNFCPTAPVYNPTASGPHRGRMPTTAARNPQTTDFLSMLGLPYNLDRTGLGQPGSSSQRDNSAVPANPEEIDLDPVFDPDAIDIGDNTDGDSEEEQDPMFKPMQPV